MPSRLRHALPHLVMLALAVVLYAIASRIDSPSAASGRIGPDFWPKVVIGLMGLLAGYEALRRLWFGADPAAVETAGGAGDEPPGSGADGTGDGADPGLQRLRVGMLLGGAALIIGFVVAVDWLGFFVTSVLFLWGFAYVGGFRHVGWNLLVSVGGSLLTLVLFMRVAYISLPLGEGPFRAVSLALLRLIGVS